MAIINWHGTPFNAEPIEQLPNGDWLMQSLEHGPRFTLGTVIQVKAADIIRMDNGEVPEPSAGLADLETAMADERKTLPTVRELLLKAAKDKDAEASAASAPEPQS